MSAVFTFLRVVAVAARLLGAAVRVAAYIPAAMAYYL